MAELKEKLRDIKQQFYAYRNGIVADTLRRAGHPCGVIFGLNVPQLAAIARAAGRDAELSGALWADTNVRESRLLAPYLLPQENYPADTREALELALQVRTREEADMLAFRILKHLDFAADLASELEKNEAPLAAYTAATLRRHLE